MGKSKSAWQVYIFPRGVRRKPTRDLSDIIIHDDEYDTRRNKVYKHCEIEEDEEEIWPCFNVAIATVKLTTVIKSLLLPLLPLLMILLLPLPPLPPSPPSLLLLLVW